MPQGRIALFDNIKGLLIILVVVGHFSHPIHNANPALSAIFDIIYLFHMPLFVFVSGLFAKGAYRDGKLNVNRIISFVVLGFAYQLLLLAVNGTLLRHPERLVLFSSAPWYLICMAWWYMATPLLHRIGPARGMAASLVVSLLWGFVDLSSGFLAISRAFAFLPCFALGYYARPADVERLSRRRELWLAVGASAAIIVIRVVDPHAFDWFFQMVYGDNPYRSRIAIGMAGKLASLCIAAVMSLAVLRLIPRGQSYLTRLGERTMQIYVLHRLIRAALTFRMSFYTANLLLDPLAGTVAVLALSALVVAVCAAPFLTATFNRMLTFPWIRPRQKAESA